MLQGAWLLLDNIVGSADDTWDIVKPALCGVKG